LPTPIDSGNYDFIFCLLPTLETHGHHKGATILALQTVKDLRTKKPIVLGISGSSKNDTTAIVFHGLPDYPVTKVSDSVPAFTVDRTVSFGYKNQLNYKIIVNWEINEHKSQGTMHTSNNRSDYENFWYFDLNGMDRREIAKKFFEKLNSFSYK